MNMYEQLWGLENVTGAFIYTMEVINGWNFNFGQTTHLGCQTFMIYFLFIFLIKF